LEKALYATNRGGAMHQETHDSEPARGAPDTAESAWSVATTRKAFLRGAAVAGAGAAGLGALAPAALAKPHKRSGSLTHGDRAILGAAQVAEALAVTTYTNIINTAPFFKNLAADDQGYLKAAVQEEMSHYLLEESLTRKPAAFTTFYYPAKMFSDAQTTLNILVTLEDAFIAAYLVGVRDFSNSGLRVTAARIMGIESDHRTLARVVGAGVAGADGGPIEQITGIQKSAESIDPPNNNGYERTLKLSRIGDALTALKPFADKAAAAAAGFDPAKPYKFAPFKPTLPNPLGEFHSLRG
jgi:ferritin-like protein